MSLYMSYNLRKLFDVLEDGSIEYELILGTAFFSKENMIISMKRRRISQRRQDKSRLDYYFSDKNELIAVVQEDVPVFAKKEVAVDSNETVMVPACMNVLLHEVSSEIPMYYDGNTKNSKLTGVAGILGKTEEPVILIHKKEMRENRKFKIKKGELVGRVSTTIEIEPEDNERGETWTMEKLKDTTDIGESVRTDEKEMVYQMLMKNQLVLSKNDFDIGKAKVSPHTIELTSKSPIWQKPRRFAEPVNIEIERQCEELLALDIIEHSESQFSSPIVPVRKKDGGLRMCIDYRKLNSITKTEKFPMPNLSELVYRAGNIQYFTKLDLTKGYYHIALDDNSKQYTAFSTPHNHYQFKTLSFGLKNSGIAFQRCMQQILSEFGFENVLVYIDDILIMSNTFEEHLNLVKKVLTTLANNGIKVKLSKCEFFKKEVNFLGHVLNNKGIRKDPEFVKKIIDYPKPTNITELRQFLGLANFQRKFVKNCSTIAKPLTELTGGPKKKILSWTESMNNAFEQLKSKLAEEITLTFPNYSPDAEKLQLFVDASGVGAGACLSQYQDNQHKVIAYSSMTFTDTQRRYSTIERELLAIRWGVKSFRSFLFGVTFELYTDHKPLLYLHNMQQENSKFMRTINDLSDYDFVIKYRPGSENEAADAMSRIVPKIAGSEDELVNQYKLPKGFQVIKEVRGGGDSLFESVVICFEALREDGVEKALTIDQAILRKEAVEEVMENPGRYNIKLTKEVKRRWAAMRHPGQLPTEEVMLAMCTLYGIEIWLHYGMVSPVV